MWLCDALWSCSFQDFRKLNRTAAKCGVRTHAGELLFFTKNCFILSYFSYKVCDAHTILIILQFRINFFGSLPRSDVLC